MHIYEIFKSAPLTMALSVVVALESGIRSVQIHLAAWRVAPLQ